MSNFICSECGMTNIDCGYGGYKTPKEIELEAENKKLKEQLEEANCIVKMFSRYGWSGNQDEDEITRYLDKWGVK